MCAASSTTCGASTVVWVGAMVTPWGQVIWVPVLAVWAPMACTAAVASCAATVVQGQQLLTTPIDTSPMDDAMQMSNWKWGWGTIRIWNKDVPKDAFHRNIKWDILNDVEWFEHKVGKNPDIDINSDWNIRLKWVWDYNKNSVDTDLKADWYFD